MDHLYINHSTFVFILFHSKFNIHHSTFLLFFHSTFVFILFIQHSTTCPPTGGFNISFIVFHSTFIIHHSTFLLFFLNSTFSIHNSTLSFVSFRMFFVPILMKQLKQRGLLVCEDQIPNLFFPQKLFPPSAELPD